MVTVEASIFVKFSFVSYLNKLIIKGIPVKQPLFFIVCEPSASSRRGLAPRQYHSALRAGPPGGAGGAPPMAARRCFQFGSDSGGGVCYGAEEICLVVFHRNCAVKVRKKTGGGCIGA